MKGSKNETCPCGSGKKRKHCHSASVRAPKIDEQGSERISLGQHRSVLGRAFRPQSYPRDVGARLEDGTEKVVNKIIPTRENLTFALKLYGRASENRIHR